MPQHNILAPKTAKARCETGLLCIALGALATMKDVGVASHPGPRTSRHLGGLGGGLLWGASAKSEGSGRRLPHPVLDRHAGIPARIPDVTGVITRLSALDPVDVRRVHAGRRPSTKAALVSLRSTAITPGNIGPGAASAPTSTAAGS